MTSPYHSLKSLARGLVERYLGFGSGFEIAHDRQARLALFRTDDHSPRRTTGRRQLELLADASVPKPVFDRDPTLPHRMGEFQHPGHIVPTHRDQKGAELDRRLGSYAALLEELAEDDISHTET